MPEGATQPFRSLRQREMLVRSFGSRSTIVALILCVHGIGQQLKGPEIVANEWRAAMRDGMRLAGAKSEELPRNEDIGVTFYGDLFREEDMKGRDPPFQLVDIGEGFETDLVRSWLHVAEATSARSREQRGHGEMKRVANGNSSETRRCIAALPIFCSVV
jgi:hypothetical protein